MYRLYFHLIITIFILGSFAFIKNLILHNRFSPHNRELLNIKFSENTMIITENLNGRLISNHNLGMKESRIQKLEWSPKSSISSGNYLYRIESENNIINGKILYLK